MLGFCPGACFYIRKRIKQDLCLRINYGDAIVVGEHSRSSTATTGFSRRCKLVGANSLELFCWFPRGEMVPDGAVKDVIAIRRGRWVMALREEEERRSLFLHADAEMTFYRVASMQIRRREFLCCRCYSCAGCLISASTAGMMK